MSSLSNSVSSSSSSSDMVSLCCSPPPTSKSLSKASSSLVASGSYSLVWRRLQQADNFRNVPHQDVRFLLAGVVHLAKYCGAAEMDRTTLSSSFDQNNIRFSCTIPIFMLGMPRWVCTPTFSPLTPLSLASLATLWYQALYLSKDRRESSSMYAAGKTTEDQSLRFLETSAWGWALSSLQSSNCACTRSWYCCPSARRHSKSGLTACTHRTRPVRFQGSPMRNSSTFLKCDPFAPTGVCLATTSVSPKMPPVNDFCFRILGEYEPSTTNSS
mmetsp:Transcript_13598/g.39199  ORF Transcript_13598/g.39199 Transcript_13598/m.39199 type:complete len:271 (-) Transcript_13598:693-1505(-)